ncbi:DUF397 domain-containing protein [Micromonospora sp. NPDC000442]|uniref:DUF397 domain-containing protein n=1 Tax=Micromonospora sp. NPDC000442 TaxID=3364217 RepID=UPI0036CBA19A
MSPDLTNAVWRKSARSNGQNACVEVAVVDRAVAVRDSKNPSGPALIFDCPAWTTFVSSAMDRRAG